ncbi:MAG: methyltransferase domain-containing protein [Acidobacteria bacterium]|nr:methyltransferase domain-containing protein [Acidobacteriota bacterium]
MKTELLKLLSCPDCMATLSLETSDRSGEEIISGTLTCANGHQFPIVRGVPRFARFLSDEEAKTQAVFGKEWTAFSAYRASNLQKMAGDLPLDFFSEALVLDAGCGGGRHAVELKQAWEAGTVIGVDLSKACDTAFERTRNLDGIHIVQASISRLPFRENLFDVVFSLGVLQHLPEPQGAFSLLVSHLKPSGRIVIWVYKRTLRKRLLEAPRWLTKRMPSAAQEAISLGASALFYPLVAATRWLRLPMPSHFKEYARYDWETYRTDWFDRLFAPLTAFYSEAEIRRWLSEEGLGDVQVHCYGDFFVRGSGRKSLP